MEAYCKMRVNILPNNNSCHIEPLFNKVLINICCHFGLKSLANQKIHFKECNAYVLHQHLKECPVLWPMKNMMRAKANNKTCTEVKCLLLMSWRQGISNKWWIWLISHNFHQLFNISSWHVLFLSLLFYHNHR